MVLKMCWHQGLRLDTVTGELLDEEGNFDSAVSDNRSGSRQREL
jgi:hypothetical protein